MDIIISAGYEKGEANLRCLHSFKVFLIFEREKALYMGEPV